MLTTNTLDKKTPFFFVTMLVFLDFLFSSLCKNLIKPLVKYTFISTKTDTIIYSVLLNLGTWIAVFLSTPLPTSEKWCYYRVIRKDRDIWCTGHMYTRYVQTGVIYHFRHYYPFSGVYFPKERILQLILSTEIEEKFRFNEMLRLILTFQKSMVHCNVSWNTKNKDHLHDSGFPTYWLKYFCSKSIAFKFDTEAKLNKRV